MGEIGYVYILRLECGWGKIGKARNPRQRVAEISSFIPHKVEEAIILATDGPWAATDLERELHQQFAPQRIKGEWFALTAEDYERLRTHPRRVEMPSGKIPKKPIRGHGRKQEAIFTVRCPSKQKREFEAAARERGQSFSDFLRQVIHEAVAEENRRGVLKRKPAVR